MLATKRFHGVVFDMDGVIADSEPVYYKAINATLAPRGLRMDDELQRRIMGSRLHDTWRLLSEALQIKGPVDDLVQAYDEMLVGMLAQVHETLPGVREVIDGVRERGLPLGLASSSRPSWIEAMLGGVGLADAFDAVVSGSMVTNGKPAPDIYLLATRRLGLPPSQCLAIEDTPTGLASAKAAGLFTVQVRSASSAFAPQEIADVVLETLRDFDMAMLG